MHSTASPAIDASKKRRRGKEEKKKTRPPLVVNNATHALQQYLAIFNQRQKLKEQYTEMGEMLKELEPHLKTALSLEPNQTKMLDDGKIQVKKKKKPATLEKDYLFTGLGSYILEKGMVSTANGKSAEENAKEIAFDMLNFLYENAPVKYREVIERKFSTTSKKTITAKRLAELKLDVGRNKARVGGAVPRVPIAAASAGASSNSAARSSMDI